MGYMEFSLAFCDRSHLLSLKNHYEQQTKRLAPQLTLFTNYHSSTHIPCNNHQAQYLQTIISRISLSYNKFTNGTLTIHDNHSYNISSIDEIFTNLFLRKILKTNICYKDFSQRYLFCLGRITYDKT